MSTDAAKVPSTPAPGGWREVSVDDAAKALGAFDLVDVREPSEFGAELGHVADARLVPLATVGAAMQGWDRSKPILLICRSGGRSGRAAGALVAAGFAHVYNLTGGMMAWNARGLPVVR
jgi:rhodanese-related sulfurtransferase